MMYFSKRIPEPRGMGEAEQKSFEEASMQNYEQWIVPFVDDALYMSGKKEGLILDVACGPGLISKELAKRSRKFQVMGIDASKDAIKIAKRNCSILPNSQFLLADVNKLPFANNTFDLVVCKDGFHEFPNAQRALQEMVRVAKSGGLLYIQDIRRDLPFYLFQRAVPPDTIFKQLQFYSARAAYTKHEMEKILKNLGIRRYKIKTRKVTPHLKRAYPKLDPRKLRESFQSRYILSLRMP